MVKKATRGNTGAANQMSAASLGYVYNEDLLDEILGEYDSSLGVPQRKAPRKPKVKTAPQKAADMEVESGDETYFEVDKILDKRMNGKRAQFLVKWVGYTETEATWEPAANLQNVKDMIKEFELHQGMVAQQQSSTTASVPAA